MASTRMVQYERRKRKRKTDQQCIPFPIGDQVEVRKAHEKSMNSCWHSGVIIGFADELHRLVRYDDDHLSIHEEEVSVSSIRPTPPPRLVVDALQLHYGLCVDAFVNDTWCEGVIFDHEHGCEQRLVFFPDTCDEQRMSFEKLRITQDWDRGSGCWSCRGRWLFLEVIVEKKKKKGMSVDLSEKEIWLSVKAREGFDNKIVDWTSCDRSYWDGLKTVSDLAEEFNLNTEPYLTESQAARMETSNSVESTVLENVGEKTPEKIIPNDVQNTPVSDVPSVANKHHFTCADDDCGDDLFERIMMQGEESWADITPNLSQDADQITCLNTDNEARRPPKKVRRLEESLREVDAHQVLDDDQNKNDQAHVKHSTQRRHANWLPALSTDILPCAERCPEALETYLQSGRSSRKSDATFMKVRMHLSSIGWKIEFKQSELETKSASVFRYVAPDGKTFYNLLEACKHSFEVARKIDCVISYFYFHKERLVTPADKLGCSSLEDSLLQNHQQKLGTPPDKVDDRIPKDSSPGAQADSNFCHSKPPPFDISDGKARPVVFNSSPCSPRKDLKLPETESPDVVHVSVAEAVYVNSSECAETINLNLPATESPVSDVEIVDVDSSECAETRTVNVHVTESSPVSDVRKDGTVSVNDSLCGQSKDLNPLMVSPLVNHVSNAEAIEAEYNPQAVIDWNEIGSDRKKVKLANQNGSSRSISLKAKQHLLFVGWNLWHTVKMKDRLELRYTSPMGKTFITLVSACKACIEQGMLYEKPKLICGRDGDKRVHDLQTVQWGSSRVRPQKRARRILETSVVHDTPQTVPTINKSETHAGNASPKPAANVFVEDGRSLLECHKQIIELFKPKCILEKSRQRIKRNQPREKNDCICSVCHYGGDLVLCDQCPSSFHLRCLGLNELPKGQWFCPSCRCGICNGSDFNGDVEHFTEKTVLYCDQCEREYHVGCIRQKRLMEIESYPQGTWFCSQKCEQIYVDLHRLLGKSIAVGEDKLTWTLLKSSKDEHLAAFNSETTIEHHCKLNVALGVMHECFEPIKELYSRKDLIEDVLFNKWSELNRLNFRGFYTLLLERDGELVSVATIRVFGEKVAEVPLVGTCFQFRRRGMCHMLMDILEKKLTELGVEMLVLPAVPHILDAWTTKFGLSKMTGSDRLKLLQYTFLDFQDTTMCLKILSKTRKTLEPTENLKQLGDVIKFNGENFDLNSEDIKAELIKQREVMELMQAPVRGRRRGPPRRPCTLGNLKKLGDEITLNYENIDLVPKCIIVEDIKENEVKSNGEKILTKAPKTLEPTGNLKQLGDEINSNGTSFDLNSKEAELDKRSGVTKPMQAPGRGRRRGPPRLDTPGNLKHFGDEIKCVDKNIDLVPEETKVKDMKESELVEQMPVHVKRRRCGPPRCPRLHFFEPTPRLARRRSRASVARHHL